MSVRLTCTMVSVMAILSLATAQNSQEQSTSNYKDTWRSPVIEDEMTLDPEQNKAWRTGDYKFASKPRNSWEFGINLGHFVIDGDVDMNILGGYGLGLHLRKAINYTLSIRASLGYHVGSGIEKQPARHKNNTGVNGVGGGLVESTFNVYDPMRGGPGEWFPAYETSLITGDLAILFNVGNLLFHRERNKWNFYMGFGIGLNSNSTYLDLLDSNGLPYEGLREQVNWTFEEFNTKAGRSRIKEELNAIYDGDYETEGYKKAGVFRLGDDMNIHYTLIPIVGVSRKISKRFNLGVEHNVYLSDNDYLDGILHRTALDQSNNVDVGHYTSVRIGINIGNFNKVTEPLYWMNPLDQAYNDIAEIKSQDRLDFADEDNDGVIDLLDQQLDTPDDCPVDTRGVILDSDGDGIVDCEDKEPYSRPGCPVDSYGVADCEDELDIDNESIRSYVDERLAEIGSSGEDDESGTLDGKLISNADGSTTYVKMNKDGSESRITKMPDGKINSITQYTDGSRMEMREMGDGSVEARYVDSEGNKRKINELPDGSSVQFVENTDGSVTSMKRDPDGRLESETKYADGSRRVTIKNSDGSMVSDYETPEGITTTSSQLTDGSIKEQTRYPDGRTVTLGRTAAGEKERITRYPDGTVETTRPDERGNLKTDIVDADGTETSIYTNEKEELVRLVNYPDGRYEKTTVKPNGEVLYESVDSEGQLTSIKQRSDGTQRMIKSNETEIISDVELTADEAIELAGIEAIREIEDASRIKAPVFLEVPDMPEFPDTKSLRKRSSVNIVNSGCGDWFLPMIHYDLNRSSIKPEYYSHLHNVAEVMRKCPEVCVVAHGHTDIRHSNDYNVVLSYKRAKAAIEYLTETYDIDRERLKLMYGGEEAPMVLSASSEAHHFMNRRVEFRTCEIGDRDMDAPAAYTESQSRKDKEAKDQAKGNKASGY